MKVIIGADHRGYALKEAVKEWLIDQRFEVLDVGANQLIPEDDYADYAKKLVEAMGKDDRGILICGSGHGMDIAANRYSHIRAILGFNTKVVEQGRAHEDANVLVLSSDWTSEHEAKQRLEAFFSIPASLDERHIRRREALSSL